MLTVWLFLSSLVIGSLGLIEVSHLTPTGLQSGDEFGFFCAASSLQSLLIVSAPYSNSLTGSAYIYQCANGPSSCVQMQVLTSPNGAPNDTFGNNVAVFGESKVVIGALMADFQGTSYIYDCTDPGNCTLDATLTAPDAQPGDWFGYSAIGYETWLLIGAPGRNNQTGQAFLYNCEDSQNCVLTFTFTPQNGSFQDSFGVGVGLSNWLAVIGGNQNQGDGMAFAYNCSQPDACTLIASLSAGDVVHGGYFGTFIYVTEQSIAYITAAFQPDSPGYTFAYNCSTGTDCVLASTLVPSSPMLSPGDQFGAFVVANENVVVISAQGQNNGTGVTYVFDCSDATNCVQTSYLNASDAAAGDYFGFTLAITDTMIFSTAPYKQMNTGEIYTYWANQTSTAP